MVNARPGEIRELPYFWRARAPLFLQLGSCEQMSISKTFDQHTAGTAKICASAFKQGPSFASTSKIRTVPIMCKINIQGPFHHYHHPSLRGGA